MFFFYEFCACENEITLTELNGLCSVLSSLSSKACEHKKNISKPIGLVSVAQAFERELASVCGELWLCVVVRV